MAETKQDVFIEMYQRDFQTLMNEISERMEGLSGSFTDTQKLTFLTEIITKREIHGRNGESFYLDFTAAKQTALLSIVDNVLEEQLTAAQAEVTRITELRSILAA